MTAHRLQRLVAKGLSRRLAALAVIVIAVGSFALSLAEARVNLDVFHWGLMYSSSYDLLLGRVPYRDTYEPYGILTPVVFAVAMRLTAKSLVILGGVTGLFYSASLVLTYGIWRRCVSIVPALCAVCAALLVHPRIQFAWPNYIAYGFLLAGLLVFIRGSSHVVGGLFFGLAILSRHSFVLLIVPALLAAAALRLRPLRGLIAVGGGVAATILPFLIYLATFGLWHDFFQESVTVNRVMLAAIGGWNGVPSSADFVRLLLHNMMFDTGTLGERADVRTFAFTIVVLTGALVVLLPFGRMITRRFGTNATHKSAQEQNAALIALFAVCGFSQAIHSYEVFRLATAAGIGLGLPFYLFEKLPFARGRWLACVLTIAGLTIATAPTLLRTSNPDDGANVSAPTDAVEALRFKLWPPSLLQMYANRRNALASLSRCNVTELVNLSYDPVISYLVPELGKPQREPTRMPWHRSDELFPDEPQRRTALIESGAAVVVVPVSAGPVSYQGYAEIYADSNVRIWAPARCSAPRQTLTP